MIGKFELPNFQYSPSQYVPFKDKAVWEKMRKMTREEFLTPPNDRLKIRILNEGDLDWMYVIDMFTRIKTAMEAGEKLVMLLPQPWDMYKRVAELINLMQIDCKNLHTFNLDEYANEDGVIAPEEWEWGFTHSLKKHFWNNLDPKLRPAENQMQGLTNENFDDYGKMISDLGGADIAYIGPGWTGHLAFVEPDAPEFDKPLDEWKKMGPTKCTLSPFTLAQNSMHGSFGKSGDIAAVPPKAATIGPAQILEAKYVIDAHFITVHGTTTSWQRLISRLCIHGPVTPKVPQSIIQECQNAEIWVTEKTLIPIEPDWEKGY